MVGGRIEYNDRLQWNHSAALMGLIHNCHAKKAVGFDYYNPYVKRSAAPGTQKLDKDSIQALKGLARKGRGLKDADPDGRVSQADSQH